MQDVQSDLGLESCDETFKGVLKFDRTLNIYVPVAAL